MAVEVEKLLVTLQADFKAYEANMRRGQQITDQRLGHMEQRFALFSRNLRNSASSAALGVGGALGGIGAYLSSQMLQEYADGWTTVTRALQASEQSFGIRLRSASELNKLANESRSDLDAFVKLYTRTAAATRDLGIEEEKVAKVTSTVAMALKLGSATAGEQASTMLQLSQAFNKGKLDGDEFRAVMENAVIIQELLADRLKVSKGEIIKMAAEGKLRIGDLVGALSDGGEKVERIFKKMPSTLGEAFTVLRNSMIEYVGKADQAHGISKSLTDTLGAMARNMDAVSKAAVTLGAALLSMFGGRVMSSFVGIALRLARLPVLLVAGATAALTFGQDAALNLEIFNERLRQGADLATAMRGALADGANGATTVADQMKALGIVIGQDLMGAVNSISQVLVGQSVSWDQLKGAALFALGAIISGVKGLYHSLEASLTAIPALGEMAFKSMANKIIEAMQFIIDKVVDGVNSIKNAIYSIPGSARFITHEADYVAPKLGTFDYSDAQRKLDVAGRELDRKLAQDYDMPAFSKRVQDVANGIAFDRLKAGFEPIDPITPKAAQPTSPSAGKSGKQGRSPFNREVSQIEEHIQALHLEQQMIGASAYETERAKTAQNLLNAAKKEGIKITPQLLSQIDQLSMAYASAVTEADRMKNTLAEMKATSSDVLKGFISDLKEGKSGTEALANSLSKIADKLIDMAVNQLVEQALGPLFKQAINGGLGGIVTAFGFADGGIASHGRPVPLKRFAGGGISNTAAIFGEAGPEAAIPLKGGKVPVDLRIPNTQALNPAGRQTGGEVLVTVQAGPELLVTIDNRAAGIVARAAPDIVKESVGQTQKNLPGMVGRMQARRA